MALARSPHEPEGSSVVRVIDWGELGISQGVQKMQEDANFGERERWAVEQCERVRCVIELMRSILAVKRAMILSGSVEGRHRM